MYLLLCKPIVVVPQNILSARECRVVQVRPTQSEKIAEVEVLDAPPINIQDKVYAEARVCDPSRFGAKEKGGVGGDGERGDADPRTLGAAIEGVPKDWRAKPRV